MPAGPEMDAIVIERVLGVPLYRSWGSFERAEAGSIPATYGVVNRDRLRDAVAHVRLYDAAWRWRGAEFSPSTDIKAAFDVLEAVKDRPGEVCDLLGFSLDGSTPSGTRGVAAAIGRHSSSASDPAGAAAPAGTMHRLAALAICRAALLACVVSNTSRHSQGNA